MWKERGACLGEGANPKNGWRTRHGGSDEESTNRGASRLSSSVLCEWILGSDGSCSFQNHAGTSGSSSSWSGRSITVLWFGARSFGLVAFPKEIIHWLRDSLNTRIPEPTRTQRSTCSETFVDARFARSEENGSRSAKRLASVNPERV